MVSSILQAYEPVSPKVTLSRINDCRKSSRSNCIERFLAITLTILPWSSEKYQLSVMLGGVDIGGTTIEQSNLTVLPGKANIGTWWTAVTITSKV